MILTIEELEKKGAQVCASRVILKGKFVEGVFTDEGFHPAAGGPFDEKQVKRARAAAEAAEAEIKDAK